MKLRRGLSNFEDGHVVGKLSVERLVGPLERRPRFNVHAGDLARRMHPCVGATRYREPLPLRKHRVERVPNDPFDSSFARLPRPAAERRSVVRECE